MMNIFPITKKEASSYWAKGHASDEDGDDTDEDKGDLIAPAVCPEWPCTVLTEDAATTKDAASAFWSTF